MPSTRALRKSPRKSPSATNVVAQVVTPPCSSPAKRTRSKSPNGSANKHPHRLRFTQDDRSDAQNEPQEQAPQSSSETGRGSADESDSQHEADDADAESSHHPLVVPDELQRSLSGHSDPTFFQLGHLLGSLTSGLAAEREKTRG